MQLTAEKSKYNCSSLFPLSPQQPSRYTMSSSTEPFRVHSAPESHTEDTSPPVLEAGLAAGQALSPIAVADAPSLDIVNISSGSDKNTVELQPTSHSPTPGQEVHFRTSPSASVHPLAPNSSAIQQSTHPNQDGYDDLTPREDKKENADDDLKKET
ncbi:hypothetical protein DL96DRAFT_1589083 [Flagelloscypha sp. PMI_526]|nr:hypothetical protein DL96DRAFT_1589083 [Flagelloscypha sp. PMI_526]